MRISRLLVVVGVFSMVVFALAQQPGSGSGVTVHRVTDHIYRLEEPTPFGATNIIASVGSDGVLLVDTGYDRDATPIETALKELGGGEVKFVINTHAHTDHTAGNALFGKTATVIAHSNARREMTTGAGLLQQMPRRAQPSITFDDEMTVYFNGEKIELKHYPYGHSIDDVVVHFTGSKVVAAGGLVNSGKFPWYDSARGCRPEDLVENLSAVRRLAPPDAVIVPAHGDNITVEQLKRYEETLVQTTAIVRRALASGMSPAEIEEAGLLNDWAEWGTGYVTTRRWADYAAASGWDERPTPKKSVIDPLYRALVEGDGEAAVGVYRRLKAEEADDYAFSEGVLNAIGYFLLQKDRVDDAIAIFRLNVEEYPGSFNVYDSLAEGYLRSGDREQAIRFYKESLGLNPDNANAVDKLKELGVD